MSVPTQSNEANISASVPWETPVGLIGLGLMGAAIAERLAEAGIRVIGWDISEQRRAALAGRGGLLASDVNDVFRHCPNTVRHDDRTTRQVSDRRVSRTAGIAVVKCSVKIEGVWVAGCA